jgi:preprotein translocase subunit SecA
MLGIISKIFGGSKSEKDVKQIMPLVEKSNGFFAEYQSLSHDELRNKTVEFKSRIKAHLTKVDEDIAGKNKEAEELPVSDINGRDTIYK